MKPRFVGRSVQRLEDLPLVTGRGAFAADISFPHQLHMRVVRSAYAHARLLAIDAAAAVVKLYRITEVRAGARRLAEIIDDAVGLVHEAVAALEQREGVLELAARIVQLEREADLAHQDAIVALFDEEQNPIAVMKWKEILDFLEAATDRCEDVANRLEGIVVKHG